MTISVRDLLRARMRAATARNRREDPHHLALVVEGGGMRGVVAGGMVSALEIRGLLHCFDSIHGSSAGACAGAYLLAGQARLGTSIYYEDINNKAFIDDWRPLVGKPIMNTHFLIDHVMRVNKPLAVEKIVSNPGVLHVIATDAETGERRVFNRFRDPEHFFRILKASITIPVIAGRPVEVDGERLVDGGMVQQIAVPSAVEAGATHILALMTRRAGELERSDGSIRQVLEAFVIRVFHNARLAAVYGQRNAKINRVVRDIVERGAGTAVQMDGITRKADAMEVDRLTIDAALLRLADAEAQQAVFAYID